MNRNCKRDYDIMLDALSAIDKRMTREEIIEIFDLREGDEDFFAYGETKNAFFANSDGRLEVRFTVQYDIKGQDTIRNIAEVYATLVYALVAKRKLEWSLLEIDRLVLKCNERGCDALTALRIDTAAFFMMSSQTAVPLR